MHNMLAMMLGADVVTHGTSGEVSTITTGAISAVVGAICTVLVMYFRTRAKVTVDGEVSVTDDRKPKKGAEVNWTEVRDLKDRVAHLEIRLEDVRATQGKQFAMIMENQHNSELRVLEKIEKSMIPLHKRIDELLRIMATEKPKK